MNLKNTLKNMTIAEALLLRIDLITKRDALQQRINNNLLIKAGAKLSVAPQSLIREAFAVNKEIYELTHRINATNAATKTIHNRKILNVLADRQALKHQQMILQQAIDKVNEDYHLYKQDPSWIHTISMNDLQKHYDEITTQLHQYNLEIQASNWKIDLI
ncbi:MAG: DIP1984 family protein [Acinetobacter sp.]